MRGLLSPPFIQTDNGDLRSMTARLPQLCQVSLEAEGEITFQCVYLVHRIICCIHCHHSSFDTDVKKKKKYC